MGGAKGMFAVDSRLSDTVLQVRPSMVKLETDDMRDSEICDVVSKPIPLVLNQQIIKTLEDIRVSDNWLFNLQNGRGSCSTGTACFEAQSAHPGGEKV